jgi:carboxyl-terminal processing protease
MKGKKWWGPVAIVFVFLVGYISGDLIVFGDVLSAVQSSYVEEPDLDQIVEGAIKGMLQTLDPHSSYLTPDMLKQVEVETKGVFGGLGIEIGIKDGILTIIAPIEDTPAFRAGLKASDKIVKIEDDSTKDMTVMDAVKRLRGEPGTSVTIWIAREGFTVPKPFTITRDIIKIKSVKVKDLGEGIGYIKLLQFQQDSDSEMDKALRAQRKKKEGLRGLVLDLRNNPGGLLDQAVKVADKFIDTGLIVYTDGRVESQKFKYSAHGEGTYGSALRLTTARYFTPNGRSIQAKGIEPDIVVPNGREPRGGHPGAIREKDIKRHLKGEEEEETGEAPKPGTAPVKEIKLKKEEPGAGERGKDSSAPSGERKMGEEKDIQLERAVDLLKGWEIFKSRFLDKAKAS